MASLWGDGFAGDGFAVARSMTGWDSCSPDEYAMLFPRLVPTDGVLPAVLRAHLEACVAVRASRLSRFGPVPPTQALRSRVPAATAAALHLAWFPGDGLVERLLRRLGLHRTSPEQVGEEGRILLSLVDTLDGIRRGAPPAWSEDREAWFAFGSGIHPAYLWAESALSADRGCTAAWLGHLDRGRAALMPQAVADYLSDVVLDPSRPRDRTIAAMVGGEANMHQLREAVARRAVGRDLVVAFGRGRLRRIGAVGDASPAVPLRKDALEHA